MLSTISKLADKAFIIGYFFPATLFVVAVLYLLVGQVYYWDMASLKGDFSLKSTLYLFLLVWTLSIITMIMNQTLYELVEGYRWPIPIISKLLGSPELWRYRRKKTRLVELARRWREAGDDLSDAEKQEHDELLSELATEFPSREDLLLPTRFGNAIRAFEDYPRQVYGADSIPLWLHLNTVIPKDYQSSIEDARTGVTCLLNVCIFSAIIFMLSGWKLIATTRQNEIATEGISKTIFTDDAICLLFILCSATLVWLAYKMSIQRAHEWGGLVKAAFDCYLPDLAKRLGYKLPAAGKDQRRFWIAVSRRAIYNRPFRPEDWSGPNDSEKESLVSAQRQDGIGDEARADLLNEAADEDETADSE